MAFSLSDYTDLKEIGRGGMATVYTAVQKSLNRTVAIKKMASHLVEDKNLVRRFENEAKSAAMLDHDNLIKIYDFGSEGEAFYIAMEYVDGPDLDRLLEDKKFIPEIGLMIALQAIKGLEYAHQQSVIHRDMKPANILIARTGRVKVLDFGLASAGQQVNLTTTNAILGTPLFMSPEQVEGDKEKDIRMDIFAVGVLFFRVITGRYPFTGNNVASVLYSILHHQEPDIKELVPSIPNELADTVHKCLEKKRENRLPTLGPLVDSLQNYFYELGIKDPPREIAAYVNTQSTGLRTILRRLINYHVNKGQAYSKSGEIRKSKAHFREALKYDPTNQEVSRIVRDLEGLEETLPKSGEPAEALSFDGAMAAEAPERGFSWRGNFGWKAAAGISLIAVVVVAAFIALSMGTEFFVTRKKNVNFSVAVEPSPEPSAAPAPASTPAEAPPAEGAAAEIAPKPVPAPPPFKPIPRHKRSAPAPRARPADPLPAALPAKLAPPVTVVVKGNGGLHIFSNPWAELFIDDQRMGTTPTKSPIVLSEGRHQILLTREGYEPYREAVVIAKDQTLRLKKTLKPKPQ